MKRRRAWSWVLGSFGALLLLIAAFITWIQVTASRRWAALERRVPELIAESRARDPRRPPVRGEPVPGNAWDDYQRALSAIQPRLSFDIECFVERAKIADRSKATAAVAAQESGLAFLSAGARRAEASLLYEFEKGYAAKVEHSTLAPKLAQLAAAKARLLAEAGKGKEAADLLLDVLWFAADVGRNGVMISEIVALACLRTGLDELSAMAVDPKVKDVDWTEIGRALTVLDAAWPDQGAVMLNEGVGWAACLASRESHGTGMVGEVGGGVLFAWRYGFSMKLMLADAADTHLDAMRRLAAAGRSWAESEKVAQALEAEAQARKNLVSEIIMPGYTSFHRQVFERRAQMGLLRMAVALRAGAAPLDIDDPFGGKLRSDGTKVWSLGADGVDGGGIGGWRPAPTGDIVLQLQKDELELKKK